ncbi:MAG: hypothetical protein ABS70_00900 [Nitrospira sp. SCN 59-13]|nr:MAG: hypothetical protein ABS70_00900 [Nitrospira sp. SCN 59-13]
MARVAGLGLRIFSWGLFALVALATTGEAAVKVPGTLILHDALTLPNHSVRIEAQVAVNAAGPPVRGVVLHLQIDGKEVATAKTNEGGQASFDYLAKMRGTNVISVLIDPDAPIAAEKVDATLCVWERRRPIVVVELDALVQQALASENPAPSPVIGATDDTAPIPVPEAAEELSRLTQYYYNVVYVSNSEQGPMLNVSSGQVRRWLLAHQFPAGFVASPTPGGLNATLDALKSDGWTTMKSGIGRTRGFADMLLQHRMEVVVVPELPKRELPRKAKGAKDWKEVRKKL